MAVENAIQKTAPQSVSVQSNATRRPSWTYRPAVDILETPNELQLIADLPGADHDNIEIAMESGILTLQATVAPRDATVGRSIVNEYGVGNFHRRFEIDESIDAEAVTAEYRDGSLTVHLPKTQQARRRRIPVSR